MSPGGSEEGTTASGFVAMKRGGEASAPRRPTAPFPLACALFFASGLTALVYQMMWMRGFGLVFGSTTRAASAVLASFFLGMAVGNWLGGRLARDRPRALARYGVAEIAIGVGALLVLVLLDLYHEHYPALYQWSGGGGRGLTAIQLLLAFAAMGPPCIAMGATLPLIAQAVSDETRDVGRRTSAIYGVNTLGAVVGVLVSGFLLPVVMGARGSVMLAALINLAIGAVAMFVGHGWEVGAATPRQRKRTTARVDPLIALVVVVSGFATLALEVLYTRLLVNASDGSVYSFAIMLAVFLVALAVGAFVVSAVIDRLTSPWCLVAISSALACFAILVSPTVFTSVLGTGAKTFGYLGQLALWAGLTIGPGALLVGIALPTAWKLAIRDAEQVGGRIGWLTSLNTLAAVVGSLSAGFVILPLLGLGGGIVLVAALYAAMAAVGFFRVGGASLAARVVPVAVLLLCVSILLVSGSWNVVPMRLQAGERIVHYRDGESGSVVVTRRQGGILVLRVNNRYGLGNSSREAVRLQRSQGRLGPLLVDRARSVAFIGVGTGISVSAVLEFPELERVLAIELLQGVLDAAEIFAEHNHGVLHHERVETVVADGRNHLAGTSERFDVVVGDLFVPWHAGTGYLYTVEHFRNVARRLTERGVFVQWIPGDQLSLGEVQVLITSMRVAFSNMSVCRVRRSRLYGLVGHGPAVPSALPRAPSGDFTCASDYPEGWQRGVLTNTDDRPIIEFSAARSHLEKSPQSLAQVDRFVALLLGDPSDGD
jgi:spermidine synthase